MNYFRLKGQLIVLLWNGRLNSWDIVFDQRLEVLECVSDCSVACEGSICINTSATKSVLP